MKKASLFLLALLFLLPYPALAGGPVLEGTNDEATTDEALPPIDPIEDAYTRPPRRKVYRRKVYRKRARPRVRRSHVVVTHGHHHRYDHVQSRPTVVSRPKRSGKLSLGLRLSALNLGDTALEYETFEGATLAGIGGYVRGKLDGIWGIEMAADVLGNTDQSYEQLSIPVMLGLMAHLFPGNAIDIYGVAGGGVILNEIDYQPTTLDRTHSTASERFLQLGGQVGAGLEVNLGALELIADVRWLILQARPERAAEVRALAPLEATESDEDGVTHALNFMFGIGGNF